MVLLIADQAWFWSIRKNGEPSRPAVSPTLEPQHPEIGEFWVVPERRATDCEAPKLWKGRSGFSTPFRTSEAIKEKKKKHPVKYLQLLSLAFVHRQFHVAPKCPGMNCEALKIVKCSVGFFQWECGSNGIGGDSISRIIPLPLILLLPHPPSSSSLSHPASLASRPNISQF